MMWEAEKRKIERTTEQSAMDCRIYNTHSIRIVAHDDDNNDDAIHIYRGNEKNSVCIVS